MLTRFFGKSAPLNYVLLSVVITLGLLLQAFLPDAPDMEDLPGMAGTIVLLLFALLLLDFIIRKNRLNGSNNYAIYILAMTVLMVPQLVYQPGITLSTVFILLALRRIFSLYSARNLEKKVLDASLWIGLASLFTFYSILLLIPLYYALISRAGWQLNLLSIPFLGLFGVALIATATWLILHDSFAWYDHLKLKPNLDVTAYNSAKQIIRLALVALMIALAFFATLFKLRSINRKRRPFYAILPFSILLLLAIAMLGDVRDGSELILVLPMLAAGTAVFAQTPVKPFVTEAFMWLLLLMPVLLWFL